MFNFLIFSLIISCNGLVDDWVLKREDGYFISHSSTFWFFECGCEGGVPQDIFEKLLSNDEGNFYTYWNDYPCICAPNPVEIRMGSDFACVGCDNAYPVRGENRFMFLNSCYCNGCTKDESSNALQEMLARGDRGDFYYSCDPADPTKICMCVTYSLRRGSELAGCTQNFGWFPCPATLDDFASIERGLDDDLPPYERLPPSFPDLRRRR